MAFPKKCIDTLNRDDHIGVYDCSNNATEPHNNQYFIYTFKQQIRKKNEYWCWDVFRQEENNARSIDIIVCHESGGHQAFYYDPVRDFLFYFKLN